MNAREESEAIDRHNAAHMKPSPFNCPLHKSGGPFYGEGRCTRCGKRIVDYPAGSIGLEFDQRVSEYHDFGGIPAGMSQGIFYFGADCAEKLRARARAALANQPHNRRGV